MNWVGLFKLKNLLIQCCLSFFFKLKIKKSNPTDQSKRLIQNVIELKSQWVECKKLWII